MRPPRALRALAPPPRPRASLEDPQVSITGASVADLWGAQAAIDGNPMHISTALRCIQIISGAMAGLPLTTTRRDTGDPFPVEALQFRNTRLTQFDTFELVSQAQITQGFAVLPKLRRGGNGGPVVGLGWLDPRRIARLDVVDGELLFVPHGRHDGQPVVPWTTYDLLYLPSMLTLDGVRGISVIEYMRRSFEVAAGAERAAERLMSSGLMLSGFIMSPEVLTKTQADKLKANWASKVGRGADSVGEVGIMDGGARFEPLTLKPSDAQFLQTRQFQASEQARIFGVPQSLLGISGNSDSDGQVDLESVMTVFTTLRLRPDAQRNEQRITREICPDGVVAKFDLDGMMRGNSAARAAFYNAGITGGWLVPNEPRAREGLADVAWGDEPYLPNNLAAGVQELRERGAAPDGDDEPDA